MTEPRIQLLDDLGDEFARVAAEQERSSRRFRLPMFAASQRRLLAVAVSAFAVLVSGAYVVPPTRAAIDDVSSAFVDWVNDADERAPGRALRPEDDAPDWVREAGGRFIAERDGVELYVTRTKTVNGTSLEFTLGRDAASLSDSIEGWRERFDDHAVVVLGPSVFGGHKGLLDERGRFPLLGVTARSVKRLELRYTEGPPLTADGVDGGFVLIVDASRSLHELVSYDAEGRELERADISHLDMRYLCDREPGCPSG